MPQQKEKKKHKKGAPEDAKKDQKEQKNEQKSELCKYWRWGCSRPNCRFVHPEGAGKYTVSTKCWWFSRGTCKFGSKCRNPHGDSLPAKLVDESKQVTMIATDAHQKVIKMQESPGQIEQLVRINNLEKQMERVMGWLRESRDECDALSRTVRALRKLVGSHRDWKMCWEASRKRDEDEEVDEEVNEDEGEDEVGGESGDECEIGDEKCDVKGNGGEQASLRDAELNSISLEDAQHFMGRCLRAEYAGKTYHGTVVDILPPEDGEDDRSIWFTVNFEDKTREDYSLAGLLPLLENSKRGKKNKDIVAVLDRLLSAQG